MGEHKESHTTNCFEKLGIKKKTLLTVIMESGTEKFYGKQKKKGSQHIYSG
jgi:hypothetical protein